MSLNVIELGSIPGLSEEFEKKNQNSWRNFGDDFKKTCNRMMDFCTQKKLINDIIFKRELSSYSFLHSAHFSTEYFM